MRLSADIRHIQQQMPYPRGEVTLIAASKSQPPSAILVAIAAGMTHFGENKVQEAYEKWPQIKAAHPDITLQFIGSLQTNKAEAAVQLFDEIASLDRPALAAALKKAMGKYHKSLPCLIQVNTGEEPQKSGVLPENADGFISYCLALGLNVVGLMCVPPADADPKPHFKRLADIAARHHLPRLSMGMSHDYAQAIVMGASEVRIGTALFGKREI